MLKNLFTSTARVKLLKLFLLNSEEEFFVRELTRVLDEQINSIRRELDNLKKIGLLKSKMKNKKKYYTVNTQFILFKELKSIFLKAENSTEQLIRQILKIGDPDFLLISGVFLRKESAVDLLIVGDINREKVEQFLDSLQSETPIKFTLLKTEDFIFRIQRRDQFIMDLIEDGENIVGINKIEADFE